MSSQLFKSARNITIASTLGHAIEFKKNIPTHVPRAMIEEVMEKGVLPCNEDGSIIDADDEEAVAALMPEAPKIVIRPKDQTEVNEKILDVMKQIVERNDPLDFTGAGMPSAKKIAQTLGWSVDTKDVRALWIKHAGDLKGQ